MPRFNIGLRLLTLHAGLVYAFLYLPIVILVVFSFNVSRVGTVWEGATVAWYERLVRDTSVLSALNNSLIVACVSTVISTIIGTLAAFGLSRSPVREQRVFDGLLLLPIVVPDIIMAISLVVFYALIHLPLGLMSIIIGHVAFNISFVAIIVRARLHGFDRLLEEAAMDLGATPRQTFVHVTLPLILPGILAGGLLAFTLSLDDFLIAFFTAGVGATTLPLKVYSMVKFGVTPEINAVSTVMLMLTIGVTLLAQWLMRSRTGFPLSRE